MRAAGLGSIISSGSSSIKRQQRALGRNKKLAQDQRQVLLWIRDTNELLQAHEFRPRRLRSLVASMWNFLTREHEALLKMRKPDPMGGFVYLLVPFLALFARLVVRSVRKPMNSSWPRLTERGSVTPPEALASASFGVFLDAINRTARVLAKDASVGGDAVSFVDAALKRLAFLIATPSDYSVLNKLDYRDPVDGEPRDKIQTLSDGALSEFLVIESHRASGVITAQSYEEAHRRVSMRLRAAFRKLRFRMNSRAVLYCYMMLRNINACCELRVRMAAVDNLQLHRPPDGDTKRLVIDTMMNVVRFGLSPAMVEKAHGTMLASSMCPGERAAFAHSISCANSEIKDVKKITHYLAVQGNWPRAMGTEVCAQACQPPLQVLLFEPADAPMTICCAAVTLMQMLSGCGLRVRVASEEDVMNRGLDAVLASRHPWLVATHMGLMALCGGKRVIRANVFETCAWVVQYLRETASSMATRRLNEYMLRSRNEMHLHRKESHNMLTVCGTSLREPPYADGGPSPGAAT